MTNKYLAYAAKPGKGMGTILDMEKSARESIEQTINKALDEVRISNIEGEPLTLEDWWQTIIECWPNGKQILIDSLGSFEYTTESKPVYASVRDKRKNINIEGEYT